MDIYIYKTKSYNPDPINLFHDRDGLNRNELIIKTKEYHGQTYTYAEPSTPGHYAFGGNILYTSNGIFPEFNTPMKLHDRQMNLEDRSYY